MEQTLAKIKAQVEEMHSLIEQCSNLNDAKSIAHQVANVLQNTVETIAKKFEDIKK